VLRDLHPPAGRQGAADPPREVPGPAGGRVDGDEGPGALPLRLAQGRDRPDHRTAPGGAGLQQGDARLHPDVLVGLLRRGPRQAGADHHPAQAAGLGLAGQGGRRHRRDDATGDLGRGGLGRLQRGAGRGLRRALRGGLPRHL
ncbi:MAG: Cell division protein MraZ, partial [uncultured Nocardioidaceae bacterium]